MVRDLHGIKRGRNELCWCGSGLKYKRCHLDRSSQPRFRTTEVLEKLYETSDRRNCSCPPTYKHECSGDIIRAHSLSRKQALGAVTEDGHVFSIVPDPAKLFHKDDTRGRLISSRKASTFTGFCGKHDGEIFRELDTKEFDGAVRQTFLSSYRTLCRELFAKSGHMRTFEFGKELDKGRSESEQLAIQTAMTYGAIGANAALKELEALKLRFDRALLTDDFSAFSFKNFRFDVRPDLVSAGGFNPSHNLNGVQIQNLAEIAHPSENLFFTILPTTSGFWASFLWPAEYQKMEDFVRLFEQRTTVGAAYGVAMAFIENSFLKPSMWQKLSPNGKQILTNLGFMGVADDDYSELPNALRFLEARYPQKPIEIVKNI